MIRWLLRLIGIAPAIAPERRRSLAERLNDPVSEESIVMTRAQAALDRHRRREEAIQRHQAEREAEAAKHKAKRQEHQTDIAESTVMLDQTAKKATTRRRRRGLVDVADAAREEARRRREQRG